MNKKNTVTECMKRITAAALIFAALGSTARAEVSVVDKDDWKVNLYGFVEFDGIFDSKGTLLESPGSSAVPLSTNYYGNNGKFNMSLRNTRLGVNFAAPVVDGLKTRGVIEMDFLGFDPNPNNDATKGPVNSETSFYNNGSMRMRHAYLTAGQDNWQVLVGQTWSVFGWQPYNFLTTSDVNPAPGMLFQRTAQMTYSYTATGDTNTLVGAVSLSRPATRASGTPTVDAGVRFTNNSRKSGFSSNNGDIKMVGSSLGLSGTYRQLTFPGVPANANSSESAAGYGYSADLVLPVLAVASDAKDAAGSLTFTAEAAMGRGFADHVGGFSGNLSQASNTGTSTSPDVDSGLAAPDSAGHWQPIDLLVFNGQFQYHLPGECHTFFNVGYGQTFSDNVAALKGSSITSYNKAEMLFANVFHDWTKQFRSSLEYAQFTTTYVDAGSAVDSRYMLSAYMRF